MCITKKDMKTPMTIPSSNFVVLYIYNTVSLCVAYSLIYIMIIHFVQKIDSTI